MVLGLGSLAGIACGSDGSGGEDGHCARYADRLRGCGMSALPDHPGYHCSEPTSSVEQCTAQCLLSAECDVLRASLCSGLAGPLVTCRENCLPPPFRCGDGELIDPTYKCDGEEDCLDGSDEPETCPTFSCKNGELVAQSARCDGFSDCSDSSDEPATCPGIQCASGERVPEGARCDGYPDCADGRDETEGCPTFDCGDGQSVPKLFQCDGLPSCANGADETGCPPDPRTVICG
jgi:low-density lipoprotein receptor-related protein 1 (alpha-2-macroglobulin receptor)